MTVLFTKLSYEYNSGLGSYYFFWYFSGKSNTICKAGCKENGISVSTEYLKLLLTHILNVFYFPAVVFFLYSKWKDRKYQSYSVYWINNAPWSQNIYVLNECKRVHLSLPHKSVMKKIHRVRSQSYGTAQRADFSCTSWTGPQEILEGCQVSWLQAVMECLLLHVVCY